MQPELHTQSPGQGTHENNDYSDMNEAQRQAEFRRQHQQYIAIKMARKKQIMKKKFEDFGPSSSDSNQDMSFSPPTKNQISQQTPVAKENLMIQKTTVQSVPKQEKKNQQQLSILVFVKKGNQLTKDNLIFKKNNTLFLQNFAYDFKSIGKVKILAEPAADCNFKIKINYHQTELIFGVGEKPISNLPGSYFAFAKIINQRLRSTGIKLNTKMPEKLPVPENLTKNAFIYGKILKKSQIIGKWQERFIVINKDGIYSYKSYNEKYSMHIASGAVKQLWTRFEMQDDLLVIKIFNQNKKTQFGIPLFDNTDLNCWLYYFYKTMIKLK